MAVKKSFRGSLTKKSSAPKKAPKKSYKAPTKSYSYKAPTPKKSFTPAPIPERPAPTSAKTINRQISIPSPKTTNTQIRSDPNKTVNTQIRRPVASPKTINTEISSAAPKNLNMAAALRSAAAGRLSPTPVVGEPGSYTGGAETRNPVVARPAPPTPEVTAPNARPVTPTPQIVTGGNSGAGSGGGQFRSFGNSGRGATLGMLQRLRNSRGPRTGLSMTPELLQRLAAQRISRQ